jgi:hypothetical protein
MFAGAENELRLLLQALPTVLPVPGVPIRRGIGVELQPFTSYGFYEWHMAKHPLDGFADSI